MKDLSWDTLSKLKDFWSSGKHWETSKHDTNHREQSRGTNLNTDKSLGGEK